MKEKRACVVAEMKRLLAETDPITKIFEDEDIAKSIQSTRSVLFEYNVALSFKGYVKRLLSVIIEQGGCDGSWYVEEVDKGSSSVSWQWRNAH